MKVSFRPTAKKTEALVASVRQEVAKRLGPDVFLTIELSDDFVRSGEGKTPTFLRTFALKSSDGTPMSKAGPN